MELQAMESEDQPEIQQEQPPAKEENLSPLDSAARKLKVGTQTALDMFLRGNLPRLKSMIEGGDKDQLRAAFEAEKAKEPAASTTGDVAGFGLSMYLNPFDKVQKLVQLKKASDAAKAVARIGAATGIGAAEGAISEVAPGGDRVENTILGGALGGGFTAAGQMARGLLGGSKQADKWRYKATGVTPTQQAKTGVRDVDVGKVLKEYGISDSRYKGIPFMQMIPPNKEEMFTRIAGNPKTDKLGNIVYNADNKPVLTGGALNKANEKIGTFLKALDKADLKEGSNIANLNRLEFNTVKKAVEKSGIKPGTPGYEKELEKINRLFNMSSETLSTTPSSLYETKRALQQKVYDQGSSGALEKTFNEALSESINKELDTLAQKNLGKQFRREFQGSRRAAESLNLAKEGLNTSRFGAIERATGVGNLGIPATVLGASAVASNPQVLALAPALMAIKDVARKPYLYGANFLESDPKNWGTLLNQIVRPEGEKLYTPWKETK